MKYFSCQETTEFDDSCTFKRKKEHIFNKLRNRHHSLRSPRVTLLVLENLLLCTIFAVHGKSCDNLRLTHKNIRLVFFYSFNGTALFEKNVRFCDYLFSACRWSTNREVCNHKHCMALLTRSFLCCPTLSLVTL